MSRTTIQAWLALVVAQAPNPPPAAPPGLEGITRQLLGWMKWLVIAAGVGGILYCAFLVIIGRRNRSATAYEGLAGSAFVLAGLAMASVAAVMVGAFKL
jgi:ABC-type Fe3+-siderophore transport system permease subunit